MTSLENTYVINVDEKLNFDTITNIFKTGFSRIPVWEASVSNIIGLLFVKDLIFVDPDDETPIKDFVKVFGRGAHVVWPDDSLGEVLVSQLLFALYICNLFLDLNSKASSSNLI